MRKIIGWVSALACGVGAMAAEAVQPFQRKLSSTPRSGWVQVQLDAEAQRWAETLWIGDGEGRPVPFLRESAVPAQSVTLRVDDLLTGTNDAGRATAEFRVTGTAGESIVPRDGAPGSTRDARAELRLALEVSAERPWVAEVEVARRAPGGDWSTREERVQLYDFGGGFQRNEFAVPREAAEWRVRLRTVQGQIRGVRAVTARLPGLVVPVAITRVSLGISRREAGLTLTLPDGAMRVLAVHLAFKGAVAPVRAELWRLVDEPKRREESLTWAAAGQVWSMPGLDSRQGEVRLSTPVLAESFRLKVPEGVEIESATAEVAGESLWFVAEKGQSYALHLAGQRRVAAGDLAALPARVDAELPPILGLGRAGPDPFGAPIERDVGEIVQGWLPWAVGAAVALLALVALALMRGKKAD